MKPGKRPVTKETQPPQDLFGREFKVGDVVVFATGNHSRLMAAIVAKVTPKKIRLRYVNCDAKYTFIKDPSACVVVAGDDVDGYVMWKRIKNE